MVCDVFYEQIVCSAELKASGINTQKLRSHNEIIGAFSDFKLVESKCIAIFDDFGTLERRSGTKSRKNITSRELRLSTFPIQRYCRCKNNRRSTKNRKGLGEGWIWKCSFT